jgi:hypothetical protein
VATKPPSKAEWRWPLPTERMPGSQAHRFGYFEAAPAAPRSDAALRQRGVGNAATAASAAGPLPAAGFAAAQRGIGNAAMAAPAPAPKTTGGGKAASPAAPAGPAPSPAPAAAEAGGEAAPGKSGFAALKAHVGAIAKRQKKPADSRALVSRTRKSAVAAGPEAKRKAATATLEDLAKKGEESPDSFDTAAFKEALRKKVLSAMPDGKTGEDVRKALSTETGVEVANEMKGELASSQAKAVGNLPEAAGKPPDPGQFSPPAPPPLAATPPGARPAPPNPGGAAPEKLPNAALDTRADRDDADAQLASQDLSQDQLKRSNEPSFVDTAQTRDSAEQHSATGPPEVRKAEEGARGAARARGANLLNAGMSELFGGRAASFRGVFGQQDAAKAKEEAKRAEIAKRLDDIQGDTRRDVERTLSLMEALALLKFDMGLKAALAAFDEQRDKTEAAIRKVNRDDALSSGNVIGALIADYGHLDESEVHLAISSARRAFSAAIDRAIDEVANLVGPILRWVKQRIEQGRKAAADYVASLDASVAEIAGEELERINGEFDTLSATVDSRRDGLINKLGENYAAASKAVEELAEAFRNANKSWWQKLKEKVAGVIRAIIQIKDMFASILSKLAGVVGAILKDPGGFLGNFVSAVKTGLNNFTDNFLSHLKEGFLEWLFGQAAEAGISVPKKFDAAGIFGLIASILGLTVANIRQRAVAKVGATVVAALETGAGILMTLKEKGIEGLWDILKEKLESLKESVFEQIQSMLETEVIKAGIMWLIGLLNPVSAFIKACKAIYEIVMFFVNNGKRIMDFVNTVIDGIGDIAKGSLGAASTKIEQSLARLIPLIIGFLASLLGLGGIAEKVRAIIARIQAPVNRAIDFVIDKAVALVKAGAGVVAKAARSLFSWARAKAGFEDASGKTHSIYVDAEAGSPKLMIASSPLPARQFLEAYVQRKTAESSDFKKERKAHIDAADAAIKAAENQVKLVDQARAAGDSAKAAQDSALQELLKRNVKVADALRLLVGRDESISKNFEEKYLLEGVTGTYASMPKPKGDQLTADHQPQAAILQAAAALDYFKASGEMQERAASRAAEGYAINLHHKRHVPGRTFGSKGKATKSDFIDLVKDRVKGLATPKAQRKAAIDVVKEHLKEDAEAIKSVVTGDAHFEDVKALGLDPDSEKKLIGEIRGRIDRGEDEIVNQPLDPLIE